VLLINATLFFFVMVAVGVPWLIALPLAVFQGFFAEFIPVVGTYIGVAIPALVTLGIEGVWQALVLVAWTAIYQQIENYWLSPKLSAQSMEINGGVAFGSALAGGAIAGPMGAFMAMPVAALITSFVKNYVPRYPLAYRSAYDPDETDPSVPAAEVAMQEELQ
jgi:predicted PurR-regulated permease PerM